MVDDTLIRGNFDPSDYTEETWTENMMNMFTNLIIYDNGQINSMNGKDTGCTCAASGANNHPSASVIFRHLWIVFLASTTTPKIIHPTLLTLMLRPWYYNGDWARIDACWRVYKDKDCSTDEGCANYNHTQTIIMIIIIIFCFETATTKTQPRTLGKDWYMLKSIWRLIRL